MTSTLKSCKARVRVHFPAPRYAEVVLGALKPDLGALDSKATISLRRWSSTLVCEIASDDIPSFRASLNSFMRLTDAAFSCISATDRLGDDEVDLIDA